MNTIPRPEYPRPQFARKDWTNLNGTWEFAFDDKNVGIREGWNDGRPLPLEILVPFPYQSELSGINQKEIHEIIWYARTLDYQPQWQDLDLLLHFGAVDFSTTVWINGTRVGGNRGGHVPFSFDIAPYLNNGPNRITLRIEDKQDPTQARGKQSSSGHPQAVDYYCTSGIWQTVWIEPVPQVRIENFKLTPSLEEGGVDIQLFLHASASRRTVEIEAWDGDEFVGSIRKETGTASSQLFLNIPKPKLWSPESPHLYDLKLRLLQNSELLDEIESYVGLRSIELSEGQFLLNRKNIYLKMVLDQGYWPESYLAAPSDEALKFDVEVTKSLGFNGARKHQKVEDPRWLYWCDKLGLLVWGEMANAREWSPETEEPFLAEWQRAIHRDYNSPSLVAWVPFNESWGVPLINKGHAAQYAFVERAVNLTRSNDASRPVIDNDGWDHTDLTDICTIHDYTATGEEILTRYAATSDGRTLPLQTWWGGALTFCEHASYNGQPVMLTEIGGFLIKPTWLPKEHWDGLYNAYASVSTGEELLSKYKNLVEAIAALSFISGFCYTQLTDVEQEINGLLTYDRKPKFPVEEIHRINASLRIKEMG